MDNFNFDLQRFVSLYTVHQGKSVTNIKTPTLKLSSSSSSPLYTVHQGKSITNIKTPTLNLSNNNVKVTAGNSSTVIVTYDGDGTLSFTKSSSISSYVSISGNTITINGSSGIPISNTSDSISGTLTITSSETPKYYSVTSSLTVTISRQSPTLNLSNNNVKVIAGNSSTVTVTYNGNGTLSFTKDSSISSYVTTSGTGNNSTIIISNPGVSVSGNVTVTASATSIYKSASISLFASLSLIEKTLSECTPAEIQMVARNGSFNSNGSYVCVSGSFYYKFSVGDKVGIAISACTIGEQVISAGTYYAFIIGFNHNSTYEGTNRIHFQLYKNSSGKNYVFTDCKMNTTSTNEGGWNATTMRQTYLPALLAAMPTEWRNVISNCTKYTDNTGNSSNKEADVTATSDKLWLLSEFEVFGIWDLANQYEKKKQAQYDYYKYGNSKVRYASNNIADTWWLRSPSRRTSYSFCGVSGSGSVNLYTVTNPKGVAPGFTIS